MEFSTTFWMDFSIADRFGQTAIKDTFKRAFKEWRIDYRYLTELVIVLNHKIWQHWEDGNKMYAEVYSYLWETAENWAYEHLRGDELSYFVRMID